MYMSTQEDIERAKKVIIEILNGKVILDKGN